VNALFLGNDDCMFPAQSMRGVYAQCPPNANFGDIQGSVIRGPVVVYASIWQHTESGIEYERVVDMPDLEEEVGADDLAPVLRRVHKHIEPRLKKSGLLD